MYFQIQNYADFKAMAGGLTAGKVFFSGTPGANQHLQVWFISTDGNFVVSNYPPGLLSGSSVITAVIDPGTFAADFPAAIHLILNLLDTQP
jgi:hypothetical protein